MTDCLLRDEEDEAIRHVIVCVGHFSSLAKQTSLELLIGSEAISLIRIWLHISKQSQLENLSLPCLSSVLMKTSRHLNPSNNSCLWVSSYDFVRNLDPPSILVVLGMGCPVARRLSRVHPTIPVKPMNGSFVGGPIRQMARTRVKFLPTKCWWI